MTCEFVSAVTKAKITVNELKVGYDAPGLELKTFDWDGSFVVAGNQIPLKDYPRWNNPDTHADVDSQQYVISLNGESLELDFAKGLRMIR